MVVCGQTSASVSLVIWLVLEGHKSLNCSTLRYNGSHNQQTGMIQFSPKLHQVTIGLLRGCLAAQSGVSLQSKMGSKHLRFLCPCNVDPNVQTKRIRPMHETCCGILDKTAPTELPKWQNLCSILTKSNILSLLLFPGRTSDEIITSGLWAFKIWSGPGVGFEKVWSKCKVLSNLVLFWLKKEREILFNSDVPQKPRHSFQMGMNSVFNCSLNVFLCSSFDCSVSANNHYVLLSAEIYQTPQLRAGEWVLLWKEAGTKLPGGQFTDCLST